jgi:nucleotide-binding universal stress UspA family protein
MFRKIIVAVDTSTTSTYALDEAVTLAEATHATLMLIHVLTRFTDGYPDLVVPAQSRMAAGMNQMEAIGIYTERWQEFEQQGLEMLKQITETLTARGIATEFTQSFGDPGRAICELAATWEADLIAMGRRGYKGLKEMFMGSVSNYVVHHAPCSVLTVYKPNANPEDEAEDKAEDSGVEASE